jgi:type III secretion system FlhB-like substrate exporter
MSSRRPRYRRAVGLEYDTKSMEAPAVNLKAEQLRADEVVKLAKRYGVPVIENPGLAKSLSALEIDEQIPGPLFEAVAFVLLELDKKLSRRA